MDFECMKKIVEDRHSVRKFTGEPIEKGVMEEILGYALVFMVFVLYLALSYFNEYSTLQNDSRT